MIVACAVDVAFENVSIFTFSNATFYYDTRIKLLLYFALEKKDDCSHKIKN